MKKQEKKYWEKPTVKSLSVKGTTLGGPSKHVGESTDPAKKLGWGS
ncbi:MAG: hypothetical protein R6U19_06920 [Bacteroidales bacterium]